MRFYILFFLIIVHAHAMGACPEFETALQKATARFQTRVVEKAEKKAKEKALSTPEVTRYKERYSRDFELPHNSNRDYMAMMEKDQAMARKDVLYFDVENSIQKKLNDQVFGEKTMVDSVNNSFMEKFYNNVKNNPALEARLHGQYKDYKSLRIRLELKPGDDKAQFEKMLADTYQKSASEFKTEFDQLKLQKMLNPRTDTVPDVDRWFLAGSGESPIAANMAARGARSAPEKGILHYEEHLPELHKDVLAIEELRLGFANDSRLVDMHVLDRISGNVVVPSKDMIGILRKIKPSDCKNDAEYLEKIHAKVKQLFGKDISDQEIKNLTNYFKKVDSLSPPLFSRERVEINLAEADKGIVSIDFTGVGVDNAYQQMTALARLNYNETDKAVMLREAFGKVQSHVDEVTKEMNQSKRYFSEAVKKVSDQNHAPLFSGDDGIYMPKLEKWTIDDKKKLVQELGQAADPSKYRITFVNSSYTNGHVIAPEARSKLIVKAEKYEKALREKMIGIEGINSDDAKNIITAIDFVPTAKGGTFKVLVGGKKLTPSEQAYIDQVAKKVIDPASGEVYGGMEVVNAP